VLIAPSPLDGGKLEKKGGLALLLTSLWFQILHVKVIKVQKHIIKS